MSSYLEIAKKARKKTKPAKKAEEARTPRLAAPDNTPTTKTTNTTKVPDIRPVRRSTPHKRPPNFTPLTVSKVLAEINRWGFGAGRNAELFRAGELSEEVAVQYVTCTILHRHRESFEVWKHHTPAVRKALGLCIHEMPPEECAVCSVVPGLESHEDWKIHRNGIFENLSPVGHLEVTLTERVALPSWRLRRVTRYETEAISLSQQKIEEDIRDRNRLLRSFRDGPFETTHPEDMRFEAKHYRQIHSALRRFPDQDANKTSAT